MKVSVRVAAMLLVVLAVAARPSSSRRGKCDVVRCANPREQDCDTAGGVFIQADRVTRCCDACVKYVGEGDSCGGSPVKIPVATCSAGLDCDYESGVCVKPRSTAA